MIGTPELTSSGDEHFDRMVRATVPGMAYFAGTGPEGKCCGDCVHLVPRQYRGFYGCEKYRQLMKRSVDTSLPRWTKSCRYFEERKVSYASRIAK